jgi:hypothetical protein
VAQTWCALLCKNFTCFTDFSYVLLILLNLFHNSLCFLLATDRLHFPFYLVLFTIKSHVHRAENQNITTPQNRSDFVSENSSKTSYFARMTSYTVALCRLLSLRRLLHHAVSCSITRHCSSLLLITSCHVKSDSFRNPLYIYILSFLIYLLGC